MRIRNLDLTRFIPSPHLPHPGQKHTLELHSWHATILTRINLRLTRPHYSTAMCVILAHLNVIPCPESFEHEMGNGVTAVELGGC